MTRTAVLITVAIASLLPCAAAAQEVRADGSAVYEAGFFATYSPANALQIVQRVPGFTLDSGDSDVRGFSQAAGNVVINSQRPSSKSETLETVLARIPASRVLRVELASGERFGSDYAGKPQVVNVVLSGHGGLAGTIEALVKREFTGALVPEGSISALVRSGPSTFNLSLGLDNDATSEDGTDDLVSLPDGIVREHRIKTNRFKNPTWSASARWSMEEAEDRSAHLNASFGLNHQNLSQYNLVFPREGADRDDRLYNRYTTRTIELGGDVTRPLAGGGLKLVGVVTRRFRHRDDSSRLVTVAGANLGGVDQNLRDWREESVARLSWARADRSGWSLEMGGEGALNRLKSDVALFNISAGQVASRVDLPIDQATVTEYRGEAFANAGRTIASGLRLDLGVTYEASRLTVEGDAQARRSLQFLKPKATLDWRPGAWHGQLSVLRTVAQLDFDDFISVAEVNNDRVSGGNANLLPQRAWEVLLSVDRAILGDGRIKLDLGYRSIALLQDRVPTPEGFDAPGNLGTGTRWNVVGNLDLPLARAGIRGGRLSLYGSYVKTAVRDPYTLDYRPFSGISLFYFKVNFRQDLGRFAWGLEVEGSTGPTTYRRTETDFFRNPLPSVDLFAEYRPTARWTVTLGAENIADGQSDRRREFFTPDRTAPLPSLYEFRARDSHVRGFLAIKHSFG